MPVNAIDFSDLTGKKSKPEGFYSPDKIPEEKSKPQPSGMGYPVTQTQSGDELMQLFPTPLLICPYPVDYTKELEWIRNCECRKENKGNDTTSNNSTEDLDKIKSAIVDFLFFLKTS